MAQYQVRVAIPKELEQVWKQYCEDNLYGPASVDGILALMRQGLLQYRREREKEKE